MLLLIFFTVISILLSLAVDRRKTWAGMQRGSEMLFNLLPALLTILILVSFFLFLIPREMIVQLLGARSRLIW